MKHVKSPGRLVAEAIARATGTKVKTITVKMLYSKEVEDFIRLIKKAGESNHRVPLLLD